MRKAEAHWRRNRWCSTASFAAVTKRQTKHTGDVTFRWCRCKWVLSSLSKHESQAWPDVSWMVDQSQAGGKQNYLTACCAWIRVRQILQCRHTDSPISFPLCFGLNTLESLASPSSDGITTKKKRGHWELNPGPIGLQPIALPLSYIPSICYCHLLALSLANMVVRKRHFQCNNLWESPSHATHKHNTHICHSFSLPANSIL